MPARGEPPAAAPDHTISQVVYAGHEIVPWYPSYYHEEIVGKGVVDLLYICTHCFKYTKDVKAYAAHTLRQCEYKDQWPGWMCYSKGDFEMFEVDGDEHLLFAQNLSLFGKLFIETKSVCYNVSGFMYYVLVEKGQIVGFFSKEKLSWDNNNLACILIFPPFQARGNGKKLMAASYVMSKREGRPGGPERPLSEPGRRSYEAYWARAIAQSILATDSEQITVKDICDDTYIVHEDVTATLVRMGVVDRRDDGSFTLSKSRVREWLTSSGLSTEPPLDPDGFIEPDNLASSSETGSDEAEDAVVGDDDED